jgi:hypothetical protein
MDVLDNRVLSRRRQPDEEGAPGIVVSTRTWRGERSAIEARILEAEGEGERRRCTSGLGEVARTSSVSDAIFERDVGRVRVEHAGVP